MDKDYSKMTVVQLKAECTERGLPTIPSKKSELLSRIMQDVVSKAQNDEEDEEEEEEEEEAPQNEEEMLQGDDTGVEPDESILEADAETKTDKANGQKNGTESMEAEPAEDKKEVKTESEKKEPESEKKEPESEKKDAEKKDTEKQDAEKKDVKKLAQSEISKLPKPPGMTTNIDRKRVGLPDGVPDLPSYHSIQESRISETRLRTVILYPLDVVDMANPSLQQVLAKAQHFMLKYVLDKDMVMKGFVEIHFDTRGHANEAAETLGHLKLSNDHTIRQLAANEAGTAYKTAVIEKIVPHLSHQIKKASDDYDTRIVYVHNLPEDADDDAVAKLFPEAKSIMTAIDDEGKNKGFAYLSFETEEATSTCVKSHKELKVEEKKICVFQIKDLKSAAGIDTKRPFHRRGGVNRSPTQNQRGGKPPQRGGPGYMSQGRGGRPPLPPARGGYNMRGGMDRGGMDRGGMRGGRGGRGGSVPSLMNMPRPGNYEQRGMGGGRAPRYMPAEEVAEFDVGYIQFQERKRRAVEAGFMEMGDGQPWKMSRGAGGGGYTGGRYSGGGGGGGGGNWGGSRW